MCLRARRYLGVCQWTGGLRAWFCSPAHRWSMDRLMRGKGRSRSHPAGFPRKRANNLVKGRAVRLVGIRNCILNTAMVSEVVHPCRVKSFRKAVSAVMDDLVTDSGIIEDLNKIVKLEKLMSARLTSRGWIEEVALVDWCGWWWFSEDSTDQKSWSLYYLIPFEKYSE